VGWSVRKDTAVTGTYLVPVYKWASVRHIITGGLLTAQFMTGILGAVAAFVHGGPMPIAAYICVLSMIAVGTLGSIALNYLWNRHDAGWVPLIVTATANMYCTACGQRINTSRKLGGWCASCGAGPDEECDPKKHLRREKSGDDRPARTRNKGAKRRRK